MASMVHNLRVLLRSSSCRFRGGTPCSKWQNGTTVRNVPRSGVKLRNNPNKEEIELYFKLTSPLETLEPEMASMVHNLAKWHNRQECSPEWCETNHESYQLLRKVLRMMILLRNNPNKEEIELYFKLTSPLETLEPEMASMVHTLQQMAKWHNRQECSPEWCETNHESYQLLRKVLRCSTSESAGAAPQ
jgi:hypothetical protein